MSDEPEDEPGYMDYARRVLRTAQLAFDDSDWVSAIKRKPLEGRGGSWRELRSFWRRQNEEGMA
jgi:hypothetical protein